jgi:hypothetical protein
LLDFASLASWLLFRGFGFTALPFRFSFINVVEVKNFFEVAEIDGVETHFHVVDLVEVDSPSLT